MRSAAHTALILGCLGTALGCDGAATARFDLDIDADPCVRQRADRLVVSVEDAAGNQVESFDVTLAGAEAVSLSTGVRITPKDDDASRRWEVEATVYTAEGVAVAWQRARGGFVEGSAEGGRMLFEDACLGVECLADQTCRGGRCVDATELSGRAAADAEPDVCPELMFVDATGGEDGSECGPIDAPCASIQRGVSQLPELGGGVVYVRGDRDYGAFRIRESENAGGTEDSPLVVKAWPETGTPRIDATGEEEGIDLHAPYVVIDGLRVSGAIRLGLSVNGAGNRHVQIRRVEATANGMGTSTAMASDVRAGLNVNNDVVDVLFEGVYSHHNTTDESPEPAEGLHFNRGNDVVVRRSRIVDNQGIGIRVNASARIEVLDSVIARNGGHGISGASTGSRYVGNRVCRNGEDGIVGASPDLTVAHNTLFENGDDGWAADRDGTVTLVANLLVGNVDGGARGESATVDADHNLYFDNGLPFDGLEEGDATLYVDPLLTGDDCEDLSLAADSPARGAGPDGADIGAP